MFIYLADQRYIKAESSAAATNMMIHICIVFRKFCQFFWKKDRLQKYSWPKKKPKNPGIKESPSQSMSESPKETSCL